MKLAIQISPCGNSGRNLFAYETAVHLAKKKMGGKYLIMDISSGPAGLIPTKACYLGYLLGLYHPSEAIVKVPRHDNFYYTRFITPHCIKDLNYNLGLLRSRLDDIMARLAIEIKDLIDRGYTVIISATYDALTMGIIREIFRGPISMLLDSQPLFITNEKYCCIREALTLMDSLYLKEKNLVINKVPAAEIMRIREEMLSYSTLNMIALIPLSKQLYFRHFAHYVSVAIKAAHNPHARAISLFIEKILRILEGEEKGGKMLALIGGLINEVDLIPVVSEPRRTEIL